MPHMPPMRGGFIVLAGDFPSTAFRAADRAVVTRAGEAPAPRRLRADQSQRDVVVAARARARLDERHLGRADPAGRRGKRRRVPRRGRRHRSSRRVAWIDRGRRRRDPCAGRRAIGAHQRRAPQDATPRRFPLDGIEAAHPACSVERLHLEYVEVYRAVAAHPSIATIGSSDFHTWRRSGSAGRMCSCAPRPGTASSTRFAPDARSRATPVGRFTVPTRSRRSSTTTAMPMPSRRPLATVS